MIKLTKSNTIISKGGILILYPLKFHPIYKEKMWGGNKLEEIYDRNIPNNHTGESWDIACHAHGMSEVSNGHLAGMTLEMMFNKHKNALLGSVADKYDKFPLLVKIIDANKRLSLQVHPTDDYARVHENNELGKNEMWYVLWAKEGAKVTLGLKDGVDKATFAKAIRNGTVAEYINEIPVKAGDVIDIPAGLLHSIEEGIMLAEVEENSDTVYRVFDWNRMGLDGKPRELHIDKALDVIDFDAKLPKVVSEGLVDEQEGARLIHYVYNEYFAVDRLIIKGTYLDSTENDHMMIYLCVDGCVEFLWQETTTSLRAGEFALIPASLGDYKIAGMGELVRSYLPTPKTDKKSMLNNKKAAD